VEYTLLLCLNGKTAAMLRLNTWSCCRIPRGCAWEEGV